MQPSAKEGSSPQVDWYNVSVLELSYNPLLISPPHPAFPSSPCLPLLTLPSPPHPAFPSSPCLPLLTLPSPPCAIFPFLHHHIPLPQHVLFIPPHSHKLQTLWAPRV